MPKIPTPLTDTQISRIKPDPNKSINLFDGNGLYLLIKSTGIKLWRMRYTKSDKKRITLSFGNYPAVSIIEARNRRKAVLEAIDAEVVTQVSAANGAVRRLRKLLLVIWPKFGLMLNRHVGARYLFPIVRKGLRSISFLHWEIFRLKT